MTHEQLVLPPCVVRAKTWCLIGRVRGYRLQSNTVTGRIASRLNGLHRFRVKVTEVDETMDVFNGPFLAPSVSDLARPR